MKKWWNAFIAWRMKKKLAFVLKHADIRLAAITKLPPISDNTGPHSSLKLDIFEPNSQTLVGSIEHKMFIPSIKIVRDWYSNTAMEYSKKAYEKLSLQRKHHQVPK